MRSFKKFVIGVILFALVIPLNSIPIPAKAAAVSSTDRSKYQTHSAILEKDKTIELTGERTKFSNTFLKPDGIKEKVISSEPINFQTKENGQIVWKGIDSGLNETTTIQSLGSKQYNNKANDFNLRLSDDLYNQGVNLSKDDASINLKLKNSILSTGNFSALSLLNKTVQNNSAKPVLETSNKLSFKNILKDTDIKYQSLNNGVKDEIVINKYSGQSTFSFQLNLTNLYYKEIAPGAFAFYNTKTNKAVFYMPQSYMYDSLKSSEFPEGALTYNVKTEIIKNSSGYEIRLTADDQWLKDPKRVYPVTIDPSLNVGTENGEDSFVQSGYPNTLAWNQAALFLGKTSYYNKGVTRTFVNFNVDLTNARIYSARVSAYQYVCGGACSSSGVTARLTGGYDIYGLNWNNMPWISDSVGHTSDNGVNKWIDIDVTTAARYWYQAGNPSGSMKGSLAFTQDNETNYGQRNWKATNSGEGLGPRLIIDYNDYSAAYNVATVSNARVDDLYNVGAAIYNSGRNTWSRGSVNLSYHITDPAGNMIVRDGLRTAIPYDIGPGGTANFVAQLKIPSSPGNYIIKWELVQENVTWFSDQGIPTFDYPITVTDYPEYDVSYQPTNVPPSVASSTTINIPLNLHNGSRYTWAPDTFKVGYHWYDYSTNSYVIRDGATTQLAGNIAARDGYGSVNLQVKAPFNAGNYKLQIDMFRTGYGWFSDFGTVTADYNISVSIPSFSSLTRLGTEDYYAKAGPVDLATGNLSYSSTDMAINSNTGLLSVERSYNANSLDQTYDQNSSGYIQNWLINGPYRENDQTQRLSKKYIANEETIRPNTNASTNGKLWFKGSTAADVLDINKSLDSNGVIQSGYANNSVVYAHTYVYSPINQSAMVWSCSDNGSKVWANGVLRYTKDYLYEKYFSNDIFQVDLKAGWNSILMKVSNTTGDFKLSFKFLDSNDVPLSGLKYALDNPDIFNDYGLLGKGWTTNFNVKMYATDENSVYYRDSTGSVSLFTKNTDGSYQKPAGTSTTLLKNTDGTFSLVSNSGLKASFNTTGHLTSIIDLSGNTVSYQYDTNGNCIKIIDGGRFLTLSYSGNQLVSAADQLGNKYLYTLDNTVSPAKLTKVTDPSGNLFSYTYSTNGKLATFTNKKGYTTNVTYDTNGKVIQIKDALGNPTNFSYSLHKTTATDALGRSIIGEFDSNNLLIASTNQKKYREIYQYDGSYNVIAVYPDIPENDGYYYKYSYVYDQNSNLISESDPIGRKTTYTYSGNDLIKKTDPDGSTVKYTYSTDGKRLLLSEQDAKLNISSYTYDTRGNRISVTDPSGSITKSGYNTDGDLTSATSPQNETTTFAYDAIGRKISETTALAKTTTYLYSTMSFLTKMTDAGGLSTSYEYDKNGNKTKEINPNGASKQYSYNALDQLIKITDEVGAAIGYQYDTVGNRTRTIDANGKVTTYTYDELNQMTAENQPSGGKSSVQYDRNGQPIKVTDPSGQALNQEFTKSGEVSKVTDPEGTTAYTYDSDGKITDATTSVGSEAIRLAYDLNNNVTSVNSTAAGSSTITYNNNDNPTLIQTPSSSVAIAYNKDGVAQQVSTKVGAQTLTTQFVRDIEGKVTSINKQNGDITFFTYDNSNRATSIENRNKYRALLSKFYYQYDKASNITAINDAKTGLTTTYGYDARNQLTREGAKSYTYDPMGNRKTVVDTSGTIAYTYDTAGDSNRLLKVTYPTGQTISFEYDANGNITKQTDSKTGTTLYYYDSDNYFTKAVLPTGSSIEYSYDKLLKLRTKRVEKSSTGLIVNTTNFVYDGSRLVSEKDAAGKVIRSYTWDQNEDLFSVSIPDQNNIVQTYTYVKNLKDDIVGLSDVNGNLVAEYQYDAWGNITKSVTNSKSTITNLDKLNPRLYSSYWYDSSLGLYFMKTRMYNSSMGRFLSKDPLLSGGDALSYNPYVYCNNNPVSNIDPSGKGFWNKVTQFASKVVQATENAWNRAMDTVARGLENLANSNIPIISSIARGINKAADWTEGKWYKAAAVGLAVGAVVATIIAPSVVADALIAGGSALAGAITTAYTTVALTVGTAVVNAYNLVATKVAGTNWLGGVSNLTNHFENHGAEVGASTPYEYSKIAQSVVQNSQLSIRYWQTSGGNMQERIGYFYDGIFTATNTAGKIVTSFMPTRGINYFIDQGLKQLH